MPVVPKYADAKNTDRNSGRIRDFSIRALREPQTQPAVSVGAAVFGGGGHFFIYRQLDVPAERLLVAFCDRGGGLRLGQFGGGDPQAAQYAEKFELSGDHRQHSVGILGYIYGLARLVGRFCDSHSFRYRYVGDRDFVAHTKNADRKLYHLQLFADDLRDIARSFCFERAY